MDVFALRDSLIGDYAEYIRSFFRIRDPRIRKLVEEELESGLLWPEPMIQLNPSFAAGRTIDELVADSVLHEECRRIFRVSKQGPSGGSPLRLHKHQEEAVLAAASGGNYVLTTGTGSGKSLAYIIPIVDYILKQGPGRGVQAIIVYPMNALANSQLGELNKFINDGYPNRRGPVSFRRYTGQESDEEKNEIIADPPDIILTNYVMLELILTRPRDRQLVAAAKDLAFLVLDELHTYRGRQGADVALLVRRVAEATSGDRLRRVGTSATMAAGDTFAEEQIKVAEVATTIFGSEVPPENVIGETLRRATPTRDFESESGPLTERILSGQRHPTAYDRFVEDPITIWIESTFGVREESPEGRLVRCQPRPIRGADGAARELAGTAGVSPEEAQEAIQKALLASYECEPDPATGFRPFAFRLHQFIGRGDTVYSTLEPETRRFSTVRRQHFMPGDRTRILLPLAFCRECGQEYYTVRRVAADGISFEARDFDDREADHASEPGYLYLSSEKPWPIESQAVLDRIPDDWIDATRATPVVHRGRRDWLPQVRVVEVGGREAEAAERGTECAFVPVPFRFCLRCGVSYDFRQKTDFAKLTALGSEGRSTATTILSASMIRNLRREDLELPEQARKLLSFTDNRQDASLQAGHFNDFIEVGAMRSAVYAAAVEAGRQGLRHDELTQKVFAVLDLPIEDYAADPGVRFQARAETERAFRNVLGYRLYRDLRRGWRITSPNLEQCGLLRIEYPSLDELARAEDIWESNHAALATATPERREELAGTLLDFMRRALALEVDYLDREALERIQQRSSQHLRPPWALDENEAFEYACTVLPRSRRRGDFGGNIYVSGRSGFGIYVRKTLSPEVGPLTLKDTDQIIQELLKALAKAGLVRVVMEASGPDEVPGYRVPASALSWVAGDGTTPFRDPIRMPQLPEEGGVVNEFFVDFYRETARQLVGIRAAEHTAQVPYDVREDREERFRAAQLPILYCSPTMELGVDISQLNAVNMRNVPPTPANYAQRSGRAGRSGQPALVFTYCSGGSPHDQYFFRRPHQMVAGAVAPPRIDLANEDLIVAHVHAIWLAESGIDLGMSLRDILDLEGTPPLLQLQASVLDDLSDEAPRRRARERAGRVLRAVGSGLADADWYDEEWLRRAMTRIPERFEQACERWRNLYRSASRQRDRQNEIIGDASRPATDKREARRLRAEAESQLDLLTEGENIIQSDFYSYRYFASEGFLPGYNFPRLPLSAYIPARRRMQGQDEFLSRPRFLAISEFGPRAFIYHEGSRYIINKVILPVADEERDIATNQAKQCPECGYLHVVGDESDPDLCELCAAELGTPMRQLFRMQNVSAKRRDRISSDEEERLRMGYEIRTAVRFASRHDRPARRTAEIRLRDGRIGELVYGHAATLWRINVGWMRRRDRGPVGFVLDIEYGYWHKKPQAVEDDQNDPYSQSNTRVIPYVEDRKNSLLLRLDDSLDARQMASLQSALKNAIQVAYQLEQNELAAEPLPDRDKRRRLLFFEAAEGGAGVLRHLIDDPAALSKVATTALELCHFDPETGDDLSRARGANQDCEAACYDCLLSYVNQRDHALLDRKEIHQVLQNLRDARTRVSGSGDSAVGDIDGLMNLCQSELERSWLRRLEARKGRPPTTAQHLLEEYGTRPDFYYEDSMTAVYVDGPHHEYPERKARDDAKTDELEDAGFMVVRFGHEDDWETIFDRYPGVFGKKSA